MKNLSFTGLNLWVWSGLSALLPATCMALDIDGGDYTPLPAGSNMVRLYYNHGYSHSAYAHGNNVGGGTHLTQDTGILRAIHFMEVGGFIMDPQFLLPFGHLKGKQAGSDLGTGDGVGDLILANTVWLVNNPASHTYFGVTPMITVPSGDYDKDDALNLGENRYKYTLQLGLSQQLMDKLTLDLAFDGTRFGDNDRYGGGSATLKQRTLYQGQVITRYNITPALDIRTSYSKLWGGEQFVDGVSQGRPGESKYSVGTAYLFPSKTQVILGWGRDTSIDNGFKTQSQLSVRIAQIF
ncbi:transporter [Pseudomonas fluorescens]|uniref:Transporter n=1 Tax=Pseudomonas fluorescens TaxID=294 RepID=A0A125QEW4_PSEFL|nr:transporter [Pseudomonas fluorescens]KWV76333.1 hypothetical protein PFL603g_02673 [Pseudomonas fluorescens]